MKKQLSIIVIALFSLIVSAQVSQTVNVTTAGTLSTLASAYLTTVTNLTVTGNIDARDVKTMRDAMPLLAVLNISAASIQSYIGTGGTSNISSTSYPANEMPSFSFFEKKSLISLTLTNSLTSIGTGAFSYCTGIKSIYILNPTPPILNSCFL